MTWFLVVCCFAVAFIFSGAEAGILSVNRVRLRHRVKMNDPAAIKLQCLLARPERLLVTVLLVTNFVGICAVVLMAKELVERFGDAGYWITGGIALPFYLFCLELLPKALFRRFPYRALALFSEPLRLTDLLLSPVLTVGAAVVRIVSGEKTGEPKLFVGREDFKYFTIESERVGTLTNTERQMINNVVDFRKVRAEDVMQPIEKIRTVAEDISTTELLQVAREAHAERLPLANAAGEITGLVNVFDVLFDHTPRPSAAAYRRRIVAVGRGDEAFSVIRKLRAARGSLAIVSSAEGKQLGAVTFDDLISRLVSTAVVT